MTGRARGRASVGACLCVLLWAAVAWGQAGSGTGSATNTGTGTGSDTGSDTNTGTGSDTNTGTGTGTITDANTGSGTGTDANTGSGTGTDANTGSATGSGAGSAIVNLPIDIAAPQVSASASPTEVRLGTPFTLFVTASFGPNVTVNIADPIDLGSAFEVRRRASNDRKRTDGQTVREWQFEVFPWELGEMAIPPLTITYTVGGNGGQLATNAVPMRIVGTLGEIDDGTKLRPSLPPKVILQRSWFWAYLVGVGVVVLLVAAFALRWWRKRYAYAQRLTGGAIAWRSLDGIDKQALDRLATIAESGVLSNDVIRGYAEMAAVLRDFGGRKFGFSSADSTTREWLAKFRLRAPAALHTDYAAWFGPADLAKYAAQPFTPVQAQAACAAARDLIIAACAPPAIATTDAPVEPPAAPGPRNGANGRTPGADA